MDFEPSEVVPPYLHILLSITLRHHNMLEDSTHEIDIMLGHSLAKLDTFPEYACMTREFKDFIHKEKLEENLRYLEGYLAFWKLEGLNTEEYEAQIKGCEDEIANFKMKSLSKGKGPICCKLEYILANHNIVPQAYHSRSFIGNHCHKYMTTQVYTDLTKHIVSTVVELTTEQAIIDKTFSVRTKFDALNSAFTTVHNLVSHSRKIEQSTHHTISSAITSYMSLYRRHSHNTITPKLHMLERHCLPWFRNGALV